MRVELRYYQKESTPAVVSYLVAKPKGNPIVAFPTGAGKSFCIADLIEWAVERGMKVLCLSHVKEIIEQNAASIEKATGYDVGIYAASIGRKEIKDVTVASVQSAVRQIPLFTHFDMIIIDECHRVSYDPKSMYRKLIKEFDDEVPVVGFTATYYRLGTGYIYGPEPDNLFDDVVCDWTKKEKFMELVDKGFLSPLTTEGTSYKMDTEGVRKTAGEFNIGDLAKKYDRESVTNEILDEIVAKGQDRKQWLLFAIDMNHAEHIAERLNQSGIPTIVVHSNIEKYGFNRDKIIKDVKDFKYRCVVNVDILTTGFDHPAIDLIGILRLTESPVLHVQIAGRGSRIHPDKKDCLILDFAGNFERLGPINDPLIKVKGKSDGTGDPIMKECPECNLMVHAAVRKCPRCGYKFPREHGLSNTPAIFDVIDSGKPRWVKVDNVEYRANICQGRPSTIMVLYKCGPRTVTEHVCVEHRGFAQEKAWHWLKYRGLDLRGKVTDLMPHLYKLSVPSRIRLERKGKYYNITESIFN